MHAGSDHKSWTFQHPNIIRFNGTGQDRTSADSRAHVELPVRPQRGVRFWVPNLPLHVPQRISDDLDAAQRAIPFEGHLRPADQSIIPGGSQGPKSTYALCCWKDKQHEAHLRSLALCLEAAHKQRP